MHSGDWYMLTGILQQKGEEATSGHYITFTRNILDKNVNFIISNDDAPQLIRPFHDVSHDIKCSYMFIYTPEEFVQEAISMITDTTIEDPTSPARKKNRQEEESMQSCDEDLPTPEYVPVRGRQRDPEESTSIDEIGHILTCEESNFIEFYRIELMLFFQFLLLIL